MIRNFKAAHKKSWYGTEDRYLDAVYRKNKEKIDKAFEETKTLFKQMGKNMGSFKTYFKKQVRLVQEVNQVSLTKAVKLYANYPMFKSRHEVGVDNFLSGLKKDPEAWNYFRHLNRDEKGRYLPFDGSKLNWINSKLVIYDNKIEVSFLDSPVGVTVFDLKNNSSKQFEYED